SLITRSLTGFSEHPILQSDPLMFPNASLVNATPVLISYAYRGISTLDAEGFRTLYGRERSHHEGHRMKHLDCSLTVPASLLIVVCGFALLFGIDPWRLASIVALSLPSAAYVAIAHGLLSTTGQGRRGHWPGGSLALYAAMTATGFWIVVVTGQL